jgi:hypothetical protein
MSAATRVENGVSVILQDGSYVVAMLSPKHKRKGATIMLMRFARELKANLRLLQIAASRKFSTVTKGTSPVSISCQIPNLRERYESFGFRPHTGYFVEVGAFDGESFSSSSPFALNISSRCSNSNTRCALSSMRCLPIGTEKYRMPTVRSRRSP